MNFVAYFTDRFFPESVEQIQPALDVASLNAYSGFYTSNRYSHTSIAKMAKLAISSNLEATEEGTLKTSFFGVEKHWIPVDDEVFRARDSNEVLVFTKNEAGKVANLYVDTLPIVAGQKPVDIAKRAKQQATLGGYDVYMLDTAGRLHIDQVLMDEVEQVRNAVNPRETLLVVDGLTGQVAVEVAQEFDDKVGISGVVLTRMDGDGRGGAALSMRAVTGKPIRFVGLGEKMDALETFEPDRIAGRILGMGDIVALVEKAQETIEAEQAERMMKRFQKGQFNMNDLRGQLEQMEKMGGVEGLMGMMPGMSKMKGKLDEAGFEAEMNAQRDRARAASATTRGPRARGRPARSPGSGAARRCRRRRARRRRLGRPRHAARRPRRPRPPPGLRGQPPAPRGSRRAGRGRRPRGHDELRRRRRRDRRPRRAPARRHLGARPRLGPERLGRHGVPAPRPAERRRPRPPGAPRAHRRPRAPRERLRHHIRCQSGPRSTATLKTAWTGRPIPRQAQTGGRAECNAPRCHCE